MLKVLCISIRCKGSEVSEKTKNRDKKYAVQGHLGTHFNRREIEEFRQYKFCGKQKDGKKLLNVDYIALSDLGIRGPGSLFGYSQSGASLVGFEFYTKLLNKAVSLLYPNNSSIQLETLPVVSLGNDFIPKNYISFDVEN